MHRGAYHDPSLGRETLAAYWSTVPADAMRKGRLSERTLIAYDDIWRLYLSPCSNSQLQQASGSRHD
jgi:hypothetical protein